MFFWEWVLSRVEVTIYEFRVVFFFFFFGSFFLGGKVALTQGLTLPSKCSTHLYPWPGTGTHTYSWTSKQTHLPAKFGQFRGLCNP